LANVKPKVLPPAKGITNNIDDIAGAGGGMILLKLAQNLPETSQLKSWLIILVPAFTLLMKYLWSFCSPEIVFFIKGYKSKRGRRRLITQIDNLLNDHSISEASKAMLREKIERTKLSTIEELEDHLKSISSVG